MKEVPKIRRKAEAESAFDPENFLIGESILEGDPLELQVLDNRRDNLIFHATGSLSESDKAIVQWFVDNQRESLPFFLPPTIP